MNYDLDTLLFVLIRDIKNDMFNGVNNRAKKNGEILELILYYQKITGEL